MTRRLRGPAAATRRRAGARSRLFAAIDSSIRRPRWRPASKASICHVAQRHQPAPDAGRSSRGLPAARQGLRAGPLHAHRLSRARGRAADLAAIAASALLGERLIAAVRFTPITIGGADGALLLGPLAVDPDFAGQGFGKRLIGEAMEAARQPASSSSCWSATSPTMAASAFARCRRGRSPCRARSIRADCSPPSSCPARSPRYQRPRSPRTARDARCG